MKNLSEIFLLTKIAILDSYNINALKGKSDSRRTLLLGAVMVLLLPYMFFVIWQMSDSLLLIGQLNLLVYLAVIALCFMSLITTIYKATGFLFKFKDFDLLMALPLRANSVFVSKLLLLFITNLVPSLYMSLTMLLIYGIRSREGIYFYLTSFILFPLLAIIPMMVGSLLAFIVSKVASRLKESNLASILGTVFMLIFVVGIQFLSTMFSGGLQLMAAESIFKFYPIGQFYVNATLNADLLDMILFLAVNALFLVLFVTLLSKNFRSINKRLNESVASARFKMTSLSTSSALAALYKKELRFFFSSPNYMLNTGIGVLLLVVYSAALLIFGSEAVLKILELPGASDIIKQLSFAIGCFTVGLTIVSSVSISLEGKSFWILKSLPISFRTIALAKILTNITIIVPPFLISSVLLMFVVKFSALEYLLFVSTGLILGFLIAVTGLVINLQFPKLEWKMQIHVVKQSMSTLVAMLTSMFIVFVPVFLYGFLDVEFTTYVLLIDCVYLLLLALMYRILVTRSARQFHELH